MVIHQSYRSREYNHHFSISSVYSIFHKFMKKSIFDWGKLISIEIASQLANFKKDKKLFMASYLVFAITYCHAFKGLIIRKRVNCEVDPITVWYQALWRQKTSIFFYEVYNEFVTVFKKLLFGENTSRISSEATNFLR
jgi:hypothetical protein